MAESILVALLPSRGRTTTGTVRSNWPPRGERFDGAAAVRPRPQRVPLVGSRFGLQQQPALASAWVPAAAGRRRAPAGGRHRGGHHRRRNSVATPTTGRPSNLSTRGSAPDGQPGSGRPACALRHRLGPIPSWRQPALSAGVDPGRRDPGPGDRRGQGRWACGDWVAVTPRVPGTAFGPGVRRVRTQPVLMDWAVGLAFPCQQPMLHASGVTEVPKFRITPTTPPRHQTPGRTASTAACWGSAICCCAPR